MTRVRVSQNLHSSVRMRPSRISLLKIWSICLYLMSPQRSKVGLAQLRGTSAWRGCAKPRYVVFAPSQAQPILEDVFLLYWQQGFTKFVSDLELYEIVSKSEQELHGKNAPTIADPARRRETKIKQYQAEKEIRTRIEVNPSIRTFQVASRKT